MAATAIGIASPSGAQSSSAGRRSAAAAESFHSVHWSGIPLEDAIARLRRTAEAEILLDRRVDPQQRVTLSVDRAPVEEIVAQLAAACSMGNSSLEPLQYIGPRDVAARLPALAAERRRDASRLPPSLKRSLAVRKSVAWPRLSVPQELITSLANEHGWRVEHAERIPHDVWPTGHLPSRPLADQLTLLLVGFDLTYQLHPQRNALEIVPIDWTAIEPLASAPEPRRTPRPTENAREVYTLRIVELPVGAVLAQLAQRLGWTVTVDEANLRAAGRSLDQRVSFAVEEASAEQLLEALLAPAGLIAEKEGDRVRIVPRGE